MAADTGAAAQPDADLKAEMATLATLLGDTRVRYRHGQTPFTAAQKLIDLDAEIRGALAQPLSPELRVEVRRLIARLRAVDPRSSPQ